MAKIYVASSWRNDIQPIVVRSLRSLGHDVYDFKNPNGNEKGFNWSDADLEVAKDGTVPVRNWIAALSHEKAIQSFERNMKALKSAEVVVLVLPCGRSAHLEFGYACALAGVRTAIYSSSEQEMPDLMVKMADQFFTKIDSLIFWANKTEVDSFDY